MLPIAPLLSAVPSILRVFGKIVGGDKGKKIQEVSGTIDEFSEQLNAGKLSQCRKWPSEFSIGRQSTRKGGLQC